VEWKDDSIRTVVTMRRFPRGGFSGRGGKALERERSATKNANQHDGDMVVPAAEGAAFVVIESQFSLGVLVHALGAPSLLDPPDELTPGHGCRQRGRGEVGWSRFTIGPFHDQPDHLALGRVDQVVLCEHDTLDGEARGHLALGALSPDHPPEASPPDGDGQVANRHGGNDTPAERVQPPHRRRAVQAHGVVQALATHATTKLGVVPIRAVDQYRPRRQPVRDRTLDHFYPQRGLALERHLVVDVGLGPPRGILGPALGQVERENPPARAPFAWRWSSWQLWWEALVGEYAVAAKVAAVRTV